MSKISWQSQHLRCSLSHPYSFLRVCGPSGVGEIPVIRFLRTASQVLSTEYVCLHASTTVASPRTILDVRQQAEITAPPDQLTPPAMTKMRRRDNPPAG